jgi:hypothetical protein
MKEKEECKEGMLKEVQETIDGVQNIYFFFYSRGNHKLVRNIVKSISTQRRFTDFFNLGSEKIEGFK